MLSFSENGIFHDITITLAIQEVNFKDTFKCFLSKRVIVIMCAKNNKSKFTFVEVIQEKV